MHFGQSETSVEQSGRQTTRGRILRGWHVSLGGAILAVVVAGGLAGCSVGGPTASAGSAKDCGQVSVAGPGVQNSTQAQQAENCFYQAYQNCASATLEAHFMGVDAGADHKLETASGTSGCTVKDTVTHYVVPSNITPTPQVYTCTSLKQTSTTLVLSNCGDLGTVTIPASGNVNTQG